MSTKKITIKRNSSFLQRAQSSELKDFFGNAMLSLGSYWEKTNSGRVASGLSTQEEQLLLPVVLGIPCSDRDFWAKRDQYYASIETKVPVNGLDLIVGLTSDDMPLSSANMPVDVIQYVRYRHAKLHPWCAETEADAKGNSLKYCYIYDPISASTNTRSEADIQDDALSVFFELKKNATKVNMMLTMLGTDYRDIAGQNDEHTNQLRLDSLRKLVMERPKDTLVISRDMDFEVKFDLQMMVNTGIIKKISGKYIISETGTNMGDQEAAVLFLKDVDANSEHITILKAKMQESLIANKRKNKRAVK